MDNIMDYKVIRVSIDTTILDGFQAFERDSATHHRRTLTYERSILSFLLRSIWFFECIEDNLKLVTF